MTLSRKLRLLSLILLLICTVGCDKTTKHLARTTLSETDAVTLPGGFVELSLAENSGSFLSFGGLLPHQVRFTIFTVGVGLGLVALAAFLVSGARIGAMRFIGLSFVGGGISNLLDRIFRNGLVTDFVTIRIGPLQTGVFNAADILIMIGIGVIVCAHVKRTSAFPCES
jgi:signal peptidase II